MYSKCPLDLSTTDNQCCLLFAPEVIYEALLICRQSSILCRLFGSPGYMISSSCSLFQGVPSFQVQTPSVSLSLPPIQEVTFDSSSHAKSLSRLEVMEARSAPWYRQCWWASSQVIFILTNERPVSGHINQWETSIKSHNKWLSEITVIWLTFS